MQQMERGREKPYTVGVASCRPSTGTGGRGGCSLLSLRVIRYITAAILGPADILASCGGAFVIDQCQLAGTYAFFCAVGCNSARLI